MISNRINKLLKSSSILTIKNKNKGLSLNLFYSNLPPQPPQQQPLPPNNENDTNNIKFEKPAFHSTVLKSPFEQKQEQQYQQQQQENQQQYQYQNQELPPPKERFYKAFRLFVKVYGILNVIGILALLNIKFKQNYRKASDVFVNINFLNLLTKEDYDIFCKKVAYQMEDKEAFFFIYNASRYSASTQAQLVESGVYQYCIDYIMKHQYATNEEVNNNNNNNTGEGNGDDDDDSNKLLNQKITQERFKQVVTNSASSFINMIQYQEEPDFSKFICSVYKSLIVVSIEYNKKFNLPAIQLPPELEYLNSSPTGLSGGKSRDVFSKSLINLEQIKKSENENTLKNISFALGSTLAYMLIRSNKTLFPKFRGNRLSNIILSTLSAGAITFYSDLYNKKSYDQDVKKFISKTFTPILPNTFNRHLDHSWFYASVTTIVPLLLFQTKFYFILPLFLNWSFLNTRGTTLFT